MQRSSSIAELDLKADLQQSHGYCREREKSECPESVFVKCSTWHQCCDFVADCRDASLGHSAAAAQGAGVSRAVLFAGESVSSDTSLGCAADVDIALVAWQAAEDDPEARLGTGADPAAPRWLQLSPSQEPANLTGILGPTLCESLCSSLGLCDTWHQESTLHRGHSKWFCTPRAEGIWIINWWWSRKPPPAQLKITGFLAVPQPCCGRWALVGLPQCWRTTH